MGQNGSKVSRQLHEVQLEEREGQVTKKKKKRPKKEREKKQNTSRLVSSTDRDVSALPHPPRSALSQPYCRIHPPPPLRSETKL